MEKFSYSVAIRTLGTAGKKYEKLMRSIQSQIIQPEKIVVVLPEGYALPPYQIGTESFVFCKKGMIIQRLEALKYIESKYTLFCDDDVEFDEDFVEKLIQPMEKEGYACTAGPLLSFFPPNSKKYLIASLLGGACVMFHGRDHQYVRILRTGGWSYNYYIDTAHHKIYDTDSLAWTCFCIHTDTMRAIHLEHEVWLDRNGYAAFDDQTMAYKLRVNGYRIGIVSDALYMHNDGKASLTNLKLEPIYAHAFNHYVFWHRFLYSPSVSFLEKIWMKICINYSICMGMLYNALLLRKGRKTKEQIDAARIGFKDAKEYVKTEEYLGLPSVFGRGRS